ncbi:S1 family peptidase [Saccharopolyspora rectivirgula]|uniref:Serine protease n=1 Tax=Saccharopolyspora rectivirgula TaxID=28042 RepID=A0A073AV42_9PSEU|nr:S1 family peptidase [Saccharopolyspora rectivirgula]KEI43211.1 serine protease [Saccharopolyspora rectivirgula]
MKRRSASLAGSVVAVAGAVAALTMPASAAPENGPAGTMLEAMQRDLGLTKAEAQQRLDQEATANQTYQALQQQLSDDVYGGAYYDAELGKLVVGVTDQSALEQVRATGAEGRVVTFSEKQLNDVVEQLNIRAGQAPAAVSGWYVEPRQNAVVVTTQPGSSAEAAAFVQQAGVRTDAVRVVESTETPRTLADVIGGNAYYIGSARCSIGFSVEGGFVTAGHCGSAGDSTSSPSGTFQGSSFPGNDYAWVRVSSGETPQPLVNDYSGGTVAVSGSSEAAVGASVCRSGSTTGWHCGTIEAKNQTVQYAEGTVSGLTRTDVCAEPGDSGGSWLSGNQAQGVTSGGSGDCTYGGTTYFQPVNEILNAYGLTLLTQ